LEDALTSSAGHNGEVFACAYSPDNTHLLSAGWDGMLRLWDVARGEVLEELRASDKPLSACTISPDGRYWLVGTMDGLLSRWDAAARQQTSIFLAHTRPVSALVISPDGQLLASSSWDRHVTLWDLDKTFEGATLATHADIVAGCRFTPDGKRLVAWSYDTTCTIWDVPQRRQLGQLSGHEDRVTAGDISPDGRWLLTGGRNGELHLWEMPFGQLINSVPLQTEIRCCLFLLDAESAVIVDANGRLTLHQLPSLQIVDELATLRPVQTAQLAPSGAQIALGCADGRVHFVAIDGYDSAPLAVTATQGVRVTATMFQRLFRQSRVQAVLQCVCPACRAAFDVVHVDRQGATACPQCRRSLRICAVTDGAETVAS
jgi:WD40 repeat protein